MGQTFTTSFLGTNDVTIKQKPSPTSDDYSIATNVSFPPTVKGYDNPSQITGFVGGGPLPQSGQTGLPLQGTGGPSPGLLYSLEAGEGDEFEIDFKIPIGPSSMIAFTDIDDGEKVSVTAYDQNNKILNSWTSNSYTGYTGDNPDPGSDGWAVWDSSEDTWTSVQNIDLAHPLNVLSPANNESVYRLDISQSGSGEVDYQVISPGSSLTAVSGAGTYGGPPP